MSDTHPLHIALITCDDIFEAGGVGTSIVRIARGLSTQYNMQVDILMLNASNRTEPNLTRMGEMASYNWINASRM